MAEVRQKMRGTTLANDQYIGPEGQITVDTDRKSLRLHDGATAGGYEVPSSDRMLAILQPTLDSLQQQIDVLAAKKSTGQIIISGTDVVPDGTLECNGAAVSRTTYADLFAKIGTRWGAGDGSTTFNLPDLRGEFLRGWDHGRGVDSGRAFASLQMSANLSHTHTASTGTAGSHAHTGTTDTQGNHAHTYTRYASQDQSRGGDYPTNFLWDGNDTGATSTAGAHAHNLNINANGNHTHTVTVNASGDSESRPRNRAVMFCIIY